MRVVCFCASKGSDRKRRDIRRSRFIVCWGLVGLVVLDELMLLALLDKLGFLDNIRCNVFAVCVEVAHKGRGYMCIFGAGVE